MTGKNKKKGHYETENFETLETLGTQWTGRGKRQRWEVLLKFRADGPTC